MSETFHIVPFSQHNELVTKAYLHRGYTADESSKAARFSDLASEHGIRTHNAIKALHLDHLFGSAASGCTPDAEIEKVECRFAASEIWNANKKLGQATAYDAMDRAIELAEKYGIGQVSVDNAFHYLWGGGYVMDAAKRGYIAYTNCTAALAEVVPFMGKFPTLGTNPHSWGFPTTDAVGFPIVIDWATSVIAMGRVQQFQREGVALPPNAAVDKDGKPTTDANEVNALVPFGAHKGYGLSLINEIMGAFIGGSLPTIRSREIPEGEKRTPAFYFQVIHPDAISSGAFAKGRNQPENVKAVIDDILGHGNEHCLLPGQLEANWAKRVGKAGGLLFSEAEIEAFNEMAVECGATPWDLAELPLEQI
ncbi:MAG: Ldh family oxidoreductase [Luteolibacter sp.]